MTMPLLGHRFATLVAGCAGAVALAACGPAVSEAKSRDVVHVESTQSSRLHGTEIGDVIKRPALRLRDTGGAMFDLRARPRDELTLLFFGYTHCKDICPTTMADLATATRSLTPGQRARARVVFVTEDPTNDTRPVLRAWLDRFDPDFVGLTGGNRATAAVLAALKAPATEVVRGPESVEHSGSVYAFIGSRVVVYTGGTSPREYTADFRELLSR